MLDTGWLANERFVHFLDQLRFLFDERRFTGNFFLQSDQACEKRFRTGRATGNIDIYRE